MVKKTKQPHHDQRRFGEGYDDAHENLIVSCAVYYRGIFQFPGNTQHELPQKKDVEGPAAEPCGYHEGEKAVGTHEITPSQKGGNQGNRVGQHHARHDQPEEEAPAFPTEPGEAVGAERTGDDNSGDTVDHQKHGIQCVVSEGQDGEGGFIILQQKGAGDPFGRHAEYLDNTHEGAADQPDEGHHEHSRKTDKNEIHPGVTDAAACGFGTDHPSRPS